jgi:hypothetical protein
MHTVVLNNLQPGQVYFYQFGNDVDGWSEIAQFRSRPPKGSKNAKFIAYADMGVDPAPAASSTAMRVFADVVGNSFDSFLLHFGDIRCGLSQTVGFSQYSRLLDVELLAMPVAKDPCGTSFSASSNRSRRECECLQMLEY